MPSAALQFECDDRGDLIACHHMHNIGRSGTWVVLAMLAAAIAALSIFFSIKPQKPQLNLNPPTTAPTTRPIAPKPKPQDFMDVIRLHDPDFPTTQPLAIPLSLAEAAKIVIPDPIYLDSVGELWITRSDADSTTKVLATANDRSTHVTRENVEFVHRWPDEKGVWQPQLICRSSSGNYEIVTQTSRQDIPPTDHVFDWSRAFSWNDAIVVPSDRGISILRPDRRPMEIYHQFIAANQFDPNKFSRVQALLDWRGLLAWMPWENDKIGSRGAARFLDDKWITLDATANWPEKLLHLVPLLDGSVLQLVVNDDKTISVAMSVLDAAAVDEKKIDDLVDQLSDPQADKRTAAQNELTRWGPGIWPMLEKLQANQPPEARLRIQQLLDAKTQPTLGGMTLRPGKLDVIARADFGGGVMFYADSGVTIPQVGQDEPQIVSPTWISIQPGRPIELAPPALTAELQVKGRQLVFVRGEWIVVDDTLGPMWWLSNHLSEPLLGEKYREFGTLIGQDDRGRWLFRKNSHDVSPTLVLDPTLPDPTPRFPVWVYHVENGQAGWTKDDWPAIQRGGGWALVDAEWKPIKNLITTMPAPPTTSPAAILNEADGTRWFDGRQSLRRITADGKTIDWPLPAAAIGTGDVTLIRGGENRLFLFNTPGRVLRIRQMPDGSLKLEATFTRRIPSVDHAQRIWLDPAGRIIIAYNGDMLAICFPIGRIPPDIAKKMTAADLKEAGE
jgi:hypothetical protein